MQNAPFISHSILGRDGCLSAQNAAGAFHSVIILRDETRLGVHRYDQANLLNSKTRQKKNDSELVFCQAPAIIEPALCALKES